MARQKKEVVEIQQKEGEWISMTHEEVMEAQKQGVLIGWNPKSKLGMIKNKEKEDA